MHSLIFSPIVIDYSARDVVISVVNFFLLFFFFFIYYFFPLESALTHPLRYYEWADVLFRAYMLHADRILNNDDARNATKCSESKSHHVLLGGRALNAFRRVVFRRYLDQRDDSYSRR